MQLCVTHRLKNLRRQSNAVSLNETSFLSDSLLDGTFSLLHVIISPHFSLFLFGITVHFQLNGV